MVNCSFSLGPFILESSKQSCVATVALSGENEAFHFTKQVDGCLTTKLVFVTGSRGCYFYPPSHSSCFLGALYLDSLV